MTKAQQNILLFSRSLKRREDYLLLEAIETELKTQGDTLTFFRDEIRPSPKNVDLIMVLGGDGTVIEAVKTLFFLQKPFFCINTGRMGFLAEVEPSRWLSFYQNFKGATVKENFLRKRMLLRCAVRRKRQEVYHSLALNEVLIHSIDAKILHLKTHFVHGSMGEIKADGLIVSTPTGSTGHSVSAGGPLIYHHIEAILLNYICPYSLSNRALVLSPRERVIVHIGEHRSSQAQLFTDGQTPWSLREDDYIVVERYNTSVQFVSQGAKHFFKKIQELNQ